VLSDLVVDYALHPKIDLSKPIFQKLVMILGFPVGVEMGDIELKFRNSTEMLDKMYNQRRSSSKPVLQLCVIWGSL
jgi:hypothetical protein